MKILLIATSSIVLVFVMAITMFTNLHHGIDPLNWVVFLAITGFLYIFFQNVGIAQSKSGEVKGPMIDLGFSLAPMFLLGAGALMGKADFREYILFGVILLTDVPNVWTSFKILGLSSEITPGR